MNKFGVHALVWSGSWGAKECEYAISSTKEAGYDIIELPAFEPAEMDIGAIQRSLEEHEVEATCSLGLGFDNDINSEDPESVARGEQTRIVLESNSAPDYKVKLDAELREMRESEMWQAGAAVRSLRPENWGK